MSAVYIAAWIGAACVAGALVTNWWVKVYRPRDTWCRHDSLHEWHIRDEHCPTDPDYDPTDDEQGGLPAAWAKSRRDTQARTRRNDTRGAGQ